MGFIVRIIQVLTLVVLYLAMIGGVSAILYYAIKGLWMLFEHLFEDQAAWLKSRFGLFSPVRNCSTIIITIVATTAVIAFIWFAFLSGQSAQGDVFP